MSIHRDPRLKKDVKSSRFFCGPRFVKVRVSRDVNTLNRDEIVLASSKNFNPWKSFEICEFLGFEVNRPLIFIPDSVRTSGFHPEPHSRLKSGTEVNSPLIIQRCG